MRTEVKDRVPNSQNAKVIDLLQALKRYLAEPRNPLTADYSGAPVLVDEAIAALSGPADSYTLFAYARALRDSGWNVVQPNAAPQVDQLAASGHGATASRSEIGDVGGEPAPAESASEAVASPNLFEEWLDYYSPEWKERFTPGEIDPLRAAWFASAAYYNRPQSEAGEERPMPFIPYSPQDAKDAARYRWLRKDNGEHKPFVGIYDGHAFSRWTNEHADEAIDAAMPSATEGRQG